jgi:hypothetical protein
MLDEAIVRCHKHQCLIHQYLAKLHSVTPWYGVPLKKKPYVDVLIEWGSFRAPSRAASELINAWLVS